MSTAIFVGRIGALAVTLGAGAAIACGCAIASADSGSTDSPGSPGSPDSRGPSASSPARAAQHSGAVRQVSRGPAAAASRSRPASGAPPVQSAPARLSAVPFAQSSAVNPDAMPPRPALREIWVAVASSIMGLAQSTYRQVAVGLYLGPTTPTVNQTIALNGYDLVPSSTERVTSFYGQWINWPGGPTMIQGQQSYDVVDPVTKADVGSFDALVSSGSPFNIRGSYVELLVTANDGVNVGTGAGQVPPVGSLISAFDLFGGFGWSYSAMPSSPQDVVRFALSTPFGDIPIPLGFNAAKGIADHTVDNRPINLGNGYSIAPADPAGETYLGTSGILPYYTTVQAREVFDVRDSSGNTVGSFEGVVTPTADIVGVSTEAILVTANDGVNVGTAAGQVPPVGSVYNVAYEADGTYAVYSSLPSTFGDVVSMILVDGDTVSNIRTFPFDILDASAPPPVKRLPFEGGFAFLPTSTLQPSGVNGLPPRDVQFQGYQQFGLYDSAGVARGGFDADVSTQSDMWGNYSQALLVTKVTDGAAGTAVGDVPPVGSIFSYVYFGNSGFGTYYAAMPSPGGTKISFKILTPFFDLPTWSRYDAVAGLDGVTFFDPFDV